MINILFVSPSSRIGGGEISIFSLIKGLDNKRFKPFVVCYENGHFVDRLKAENISVFVFKRDSILSNFLIVCKIIRFCRYYKINIIHVNCLDIRAGIAAWIWGVPCLGHLRVILPFSWRDHLFIRLSKKTLAVSQAAIESFISRGFFKDKFIVVPNAVYIPENLKIVSLQKEYGFLDNSLVVGTVGRIDSLKGYEYFIRAANNIRKKFKNIYFIIVGSVGKDDKLGKEYLDMLKREAKSLGILNNLVFTGFREDVLDIMNAFDVLVIPSLLIKKDGSNMTEAFGRVAVEGMALKIPIVASNVGGLKEIVKNNKSGLLVPPSNPDAISDAVCSVLADKKRAIAMCDEGRKRFEEKYTIKKHVKTISTVYMQLIT